MRRQVSVTTLIDRLQQQTPLLLQRYHVETLGVFGSRLRQEDRPDSDLDLLVTFHEPPSLLKFIELENYLSDTLGVKVDLVMPDDLKPAIGLHVLREVRPIYEVHTNTR
jgi:uncharacterized protein